MKWHINYEQWSTELESEKKTIDDLCVAIGFVLDFRQLWFSSGLCALHGVHSGFSFCFVVFCRCCCCVVDMHHKAGARRVRLSPGSVYNGYIVIIQASLSDRHLSKSCSADNVPVKVCAQPFSMHCFRRCVRLKKDLVLCHIHVHPFYSCLFCTVHSPTLRIAIALFMPSTVCSTFHSSCSLCHFLRYCATHCLCVCAVRTEVASCKFLVTQPRKNAINSSKSCDLWVVVSSMVPSNRPTDNSVIRFCRWCNDV